MLRKNTNPNEQTVVITLGADGSIQTEVQGVKGASCYDVTKQTEQALGSVQTDERTAEYSERERPQETDNVRFANYRH